MKVYNDAGYITYLLDLFEGRLSLEDIMNYDLSLIMSMRESKEKQLEKRSQAIRKASNPASKIPSASNNDNTHGHLNPISNIR